MMTLTELINQIAADNDKVTAEEVGEVAKALFVGIGKALEEDGHFTVLDFGRFEVYEKESKIQISFHPAQQLKLRLMGGFNVE